MSVYVGIDVHRKRSQIAVIDEDGAVRVNRNVPNGVETVLGVIGDLPIGTPVAFEAAYGWGWLVELLEDYGYESHLVHPLRLQGDRLGQAEERQGRRRDPGPATTRRSPPGGVDRPAGRAPAAHPAPPPLPAGAVAHAPAQPGPCGPRRPRPRPARRVLHRSWPGLARVPRAAGRLPTRGGRPVADHGRPAVPIDALDKQLTAHARGDPRVKALMELPGVGTLTALVILAEVGDITRFPSARKLAAWAGLTPTVRASDLTVHQGHISKQGSAWLRWILCEAAQTAKRSPAFADTYQAIAARRGKKIATTAIARKLLTRAYHLLRADRDQRNRPAR